MSRARTLHNIASRCHAGTGGHREMGGGLYVYARVPVAGDADANNLETQRRVLSDCKQVFEDVGRGASWSRPRLNSPKVALAPCDCVEMAVLNRLGWSLTKVLEVPGLGEEEPRSRTSASGS